MVSKTSQIGRTHWALAPALFSIAQFVLGVAYFISIIGKDVRSILLHGRAHINDARKLDHLDIEPSNICNANCVFCAYQYQDGKSYRQIDRQQAERLLDSFCAAGGGDIGLTPVVGDPLIAPNIEELVALCRSHKEIKRIGMTTNGILLSPERFAALRAAGLTDLVISMTYPEEKEYETIFRSKRYRQLMQNLESLVLIDTGGLEVTLALRTPRLFLRNHPLLTQARKAGWTISKNVFFDDWSSSVNEALHEHGLMKRPLRGQYLPCTMLQSGPHMLASGRLTACGCRDLDGKSELSSEEIFRPFYQSGDLRKVYDETIEPLRKRFADGSQPVICATCRHYNPEFRFASYKGKLTQLRADAKAAMLHIMQART